MYEKLFNLFYIYLFVLLLNSFVIKCSEIENKSNGEHREKRFINEGESAKNKSDDYDYAEETDEKDSYNDHNEESFLDKLKLMHEKGRNHTFTKKVKHINDTFDILNDVRNNFGSLFGINANEKSKLIELISDIDLGLSPECMASFVKIFRGIQNKDIWAMKFVDSMGSVSPHGFLEGILSDFGEYDECLSIRSPMTEKNGLIIKGQFCMSRIILPFPARGSYKEGEPVNQELDFSEKYGKNSLLSEMTVNSMIEALNVINGSIYRMGICIPSTCRPYEVENMINKILQPITRLPIELDSKCHIKDEPIMLDNYQMISITIISILLILVISSTGLEFYKNYNNLELPKSETTKCDEIFLSFSLIKNTRSLFAESNKRFAALDTIRLFLIVHVHVIHSYCISLFYGLIGAKKIFSWIMPRVFDDSRYFFVRSPLIIDALFTLSGFLISYGILRKLQNSGGRFNYFSFIFQQWARFVVLAFASIMFFYLYPLTGDGPIWDYGVEYVTDGCKNPSNLINIFFFINNYNDWQFDNFNTTCNTPLWFLSTLLQFLAMAPLFIIIYYKNPKFGIIAIIGGILLALFASIAPQILFGVNTYLQVLVHGTKLLSTNIGASFNWYHTTPNNHATGFFVGIAFGFLMIKKFRFSRSQEKLFWCLTPVMIIGVYYWHNSFWKPGNSEPVISALLWHSIGKLMFTTTVGWIYFACCSGRGGYLNQCLSWRGFQPLARLSFCIYLLHYLTIFNQVFSLKENILMTDEVMVHKIIIGLLTNLVIAYIFYILIECPFSNIFKTLFAGKPVQKTVISEYINETNAQQKL